MLMRTNLLRNFLLGSLTLIAFSIKPLQAQTSENTPVVSTTPEVSSSLRTHNNMWYFKPFSLLYGAQVGYMNNVRDRVFVGGEVAFGAWNGAPYSIMAVPSLRYYYRLGDITRSFAAYISLKAQIGCYYGLATKTPYDQEKSKSTALFVGAGIGTGFQIAIDKAGRLHIFSEATLRLNNLEGDRELPSLDGDHDFSSRLTYYTMMCPTSPIELAIGVSYLF